MTNPYAIPGPAHETRVVTHATASRNGEPYSALIAKRRAMEKAA